jgi:16S rRNA (adenine1518-N6/adenine1519-N6)-dimethyltransferase
VTSPSAIRRLLEGRGIRPKRSLGQTFLINGRVIDRLLELSGIGAWDSVLEIGTGPGHVTRELALRAAQVVGIELDVALAAIARQWLAPMANVRIVQGDGADFARHLAPGRSWIVFSNLPYPSVQRLLGRILAAPACVTAAILMVQEEVYRKLAAEPGTRAYGPLSVLAQATGRLTRMMRVAPAAFYPAPRVDSAVFRWDRRGPGWSAAQIERMHRALAGIFRRRRRRLERRWVRLPPVELARHALEAPLQPPTGEPPNSSVSSA